MSFIAAAELCLVLRELGIPVQPQRQHAAVCFDDGTCLEVVEVEVSSSSAVADLQAAARSARSRHAIVLVTSQLPPTHRDVLEVSGVGWLDRRGHLRLPSHGIDRPIPDLTAPAPNAPDIWWRPDVIAVALALLQHDGPVPPIRKLGLHADISRYAAEGALEDLRRASLIDDQEIPRRDMLLVHLIARWHTRWFGLDTRPDVAELDAEERLVLGADDDLRRPGWASLDHEQEPTATAAPPRLLVPDRRALAWMRRRWGTATRDEPAALVAAAPNPTATAARRPGPAGYPLAHPITIEVQRRATGFAR